MFYGRPLSECPHKSHTLVLFGKNLKTTLGHPHLKNLTHPLSAKCQQWKENLLDCGHFYGEIPTATATSAQRSHLVTNETPVIADSSDYLCRKG